MEDPTRHHARDDGIRVGRLALWVFGLTAAVLLVIYALIEVFERTAREEIYVKQLRPVSSILAAQRARDAERLGSYAILDEEAGIYRIPIERAMDLVAAHPERLHASSP